MPSNPLLPHCRLLLPRLPPKPQKLHSRRRGLSRPRNRLLKPLPVRLQLKRLLLKRLLLKRLLLLRRQLLRRPPKLRRLRRQLSKPRPQRQHRSRL